MAYLFARGRGLKPAEILAPHRRRLARAAFMSGFLCFHVSFLTPAAWAVEDADCFICHADPEARMTNEFGHEVSLFVDEGIYASSVHAAGGCTACHYDIEDLPHAEELAPVQCEACHEQGDVYQRSLHGQALEAGDPLAPHCWDCHGKHDIRPATDPTSKMSPVNIPAMCGQCHAENAPVAQSRNIDQHNILEHYTESIHGEGLLQKGLTVTAVCTSCHTAHNVLPHTDPESTIHRDNVVKTCTKCHALIEEVHTKVIEGQLWESEPHKIPICIDCHQPHAVRKVFYDEGVSDRECMACHNIPIEGTAGVIPAVDVAGLIGSTHKSVRCAQCHTGASPLAARACETIADTVDCSICHAAQTEQHAQSVHGLLLAQGDADAPACLDCHASHTTQSKDDPASPTFAKNIPALCARCHREGERAAVRRPESELHFIVEEYAESVHGRGLIRSGLVVSATCTDCHTAHMPLPADDPRSSINRGNVPHTCGRCHSGIEETFLQSIHSPLVSDVPAEELPVCSECHSAHSIRQTDEAAFKLDVKTTCGRCHEDVMDTYFDTYHGKVSKLGSDRAAKCHDCHGAHDVLPIADPASHLSRDNIVATCGKCHEGSHRRFAGYLTHATHHDPAKYPALFYTFWAMTILLTGTFVFFGLHTLAWLPLSFKEMKRHRAQVRAERAENRKMFRRFDPIVRQMHFVLIITFFGLALTGMTLKFSYMPWAQWLSKALGGFHSMGIIHRVCATVMVIVFIIHLIVIGHRKRKHGMTWKDLLTGPSTLAPTWSDVRDFIATIKWFRGGGPRPQYGRWTYWEKFDYFAVFWGIAIIGSTGFILWFPEFCTRFLPGWFINVATIIHSDEALLATGFIFTIHFFNTHFRPEKFPMDMVMFTGNVSVEELKREKPKYYDELVESGELEARLTPQVGPEFRFWAALFGALALIIGFSLVGFILWSMLFGYR